MKSHPTRLACAVALALTCTAGPVLAQAPSQNATVNLIRLLVQQGVLPQAQADALVAQAEAEAAQARKVDIGAAGAAQARPGDVRVTYIPETVREQIREEVKNEVMSQAKAENWAQPDGYNDSSFHLGGTNARGYFLGAGYAFEKNVTGHLRWSSSKEVYGAPLSIDIIQLELNARL